MNTATKKTGLRINSGIKAGGLSDANHSRLALKVRTGLKAGSKAAMNHNRRLMACA